MKGRPFPDYSILLHPQIPKPLHLLNPRTIFGQGWWDSQRQIAYAKHNYCCHACGIHKSLAEYYHWLEAHEFYSIDYTTGKAEFIDLVALCHACHNFIHEGRMQILMEKGELEKSKYKNIIKMGKNLLKAHNIKDTRTHDINKLYEQGKLYRWANWHLIINKKNYGQRFKTYKEWAKYWGIAMEITPDIYSDLYGDR